MMINIKIDILLGNEVYKSDSNNIIITLFAIFVLFCKKVEFVSASCYNILHKFYINL